VRLLRRKADPRIEAATAAYAAGDFLRARELAVEVVADGDHSLEALRGLAELEYLLGDYDAAERLLRRVVEDAGRKTAVRVDAEVALALVYLQTNRFAETHTLFAGLDGAIDLPLWELMKSFGDERPYRIDWAGEAAVALPFLQSTTWELPRVRIEVDGLEVDMRIDTGGELLTLSPDVAAVLGVETVVSADGVFAAGALGEIGYGRVDRVRVGPVTVRAVPVAVMALEQPVIGTGFLRQFLATLDYPRWRLVLRLRSERAPAGVEVPFALAAGHLLLARGSLEEREPLTFIVDSGLEDEGGAAVALPQEILDLLGIPAPPLTEEIGESGAGHLSLRFGRFPLRRVGLGPLVHEDASGLFGIFPDVWTDLGGIAVHGIISHGFLRRYAWTLDFERMAMIFADPD
jgi:Aspartyl protease/Tetratricopeptide repeat